MDDNVPDIVRDHKLTTQFDRSNTVHIYDDPDAPPSAPKRLEHWKKSQTLGRGGQGEVVLQTCTSGGRNYTQRAVKRIRIQDNDTRQRYKRELEVIIKFSHDKYSKYFVKTLGWYTSSNTLYIAMEYLPAGDLHTYISKYGRLPEDECRQITSQISSGIDLMHAQGFAHRDIKPQNILIHRRPIPPDAWWIKLADFGISKRLGGDTSTTWITGTPLYMPPELLRSDQASESHVDYRMSDMWALGITTFFLLTKSLPFSDQYSIVEYARKLDELFPRASLDECQVSEDGQKFIYELLRPQPEGRLVSGAVMRHPWIHAWVPELLAIPDMRSGSSASSSRRSSFDSQKEIRTETSDSTFKLYSNQWSEGESSTLRPTSNTKPTDNPSSIPKSNQMNIEQTEWSEKSTVIEPAKKEEIPDPYWDRSKVRTPHEAAKHGLAKVMIQFLKKGANVRSRDENGWTLVNTAAHNGHVEMVGLLLTYGADITTPNKNGEAPIHSASRNGHEAVVSLLIGKGARMRVKDNNGFTPLLWAAAGGHEAVVRLLVERGANLEAKTNKYRSTPLLLAATKGHAAVVRLLVEKGADLEVKTTENGNTPLLQAAANGHEAVTRLLIEKGANIEAKTNGNTPLIRAASEGHEAVVRLLVDKGANLEAKTNKYRNTPLLLAATKGHAAVVRLLVEKGANLEVKITENGNTPLLQAATKGHEAVVRLLIEKGAKLEATGNNGFTPLLCAAAAGHEAVVRLLVEKGADLEVKTVTRGNTPLLQAAAEGHEAVVRLLIDEGVNLEVKDKSGFNPLLWAVANGRSAVVKLLVEKGANLEVKSWKGNTPLLLAVMEGYEAIVKSLIEGGAKLEVEDKNGNTPLLLAVQNREPAIRRLLVQGGARRGFRYYYLRSSNR